jgi:hypothetical protein
VKLGVVCVDLETGEHDGGLLQDLQLVRLHLRWGVGQDDVAAQVLVR